MPIQFEKRKKIVARWEKKKNQNPQLKCKHPYIEKEYYFGSPTGDYLCTKCGEAFMKEEKDQLELHRKTIVRASK
jgi:hypothetical protein